MRHPRSTEPPIAASETYALWKVLLDLILLPC